jgi:hypothetical protein
MAQAPTSTQAAPKPTTTPSPNSPQAPKAHEEHPYTPEETKQFVGDLKPGEVGYIKLGEDGKPTGAATKTAPEGAYATVVVPHRPVPEEITTPTGAPLTHNMNPSPHMWDEGMLSRNPIHGSTQAPKEAEQAKA